MKRTFAFAHLVIFLVIIANAHGQSSISGYWDFQVPRIANNDGTYREYFFELIQVDDKVTGRIEPGGVREHPLLEGTIENGRLHFVVMFPRGNGAPNRMVYEGTREANGHFTFTSTSADGTVSRGELVPVSKETALPPPRLELPALVNMPDNGLARTPPMGWNSWNKFNARITDADVRGIADAMVATGMAKVGYTYINIDDGWEGQKRDANGNITTNSKFPDMKALADYVHAKGLKIGIYSSPGPFTCAGYEGSYGHEEQDAKQYAAWGIDYLKYDWCGARNVYPETEEQAVYQKMADALRKSGREIVYSLCQYGHVNVWEWGSKAGGNLWRTTGDINDNWASLDLICFGNQWGVTQLGIASFGKAGHFNDPDMLEIGNGGMTDDEYRLHMSVWAMLSAPLIAGNDLRNMTEATKSILMNTEVIAIDQDKAVNPARALQLPGTSDMLQIWAKNLADGAVAVGFFNRSDHPAPLKLDTATLGIKSNKLYGRDLWAHNPVELTNGCYTAIVPTHGMVMLKISAARP
jgi:alpha-galactosidase